MKNKLFEHILSIIFVSIVLFALLFYVKYDKESVSAQNNKNIEDILHNKFIDFDDALNKIIFKETLDYYYPNSKEKNDSLYEAIISYRSEKLLQSIDKARHQRGINEGTLFNILNMYIKFILIYIIVLLLSYYGAPTIGVYRFIKKMQNRSSYLQLFFNFIGKKDKKIDYAFMMEASVYLGKAIIKGVTYFALFSPAYVLAYSFKTEINTGSVFFMIFLGVISNGMLIIYSNKFYTFLVAESRKGYIQTAIVKNLNNNYRYDKENGITKKAIFSLHKKFPGHVFQQIFDNAHFQYLSTFKEQASFLVSSLIIIEMALNIQGYLSYQLLQEVLYKNYELVIIIILAIFYLVKFTDIASDWLLFKESKKYENN